MTPYITNYAERDASRNAYLSWLRNAEESLKHRPTPAQPVMERSPLSAALLRKQLLQTI